MAASCFPVFADTPSVTNGSPKVKAFGASWGTSGDHVSRTASRSYLSLERLISDSDVVAIVEVSDPGGGTPELKREKFAPGPRAASARVSQAMKGKPPGVVSIFHATGRDDALFQQGPGQYLVFLRKADDGYIPTDGWPSSKPIRDGYVVGWSDSHSWSVKDSLADAVAKIRSASDKQ